MRMAVGTPTCGYRCSNDKREWGKDAGCCERDLCERPLRRDTGHARRKSALYESEQQHCSLSS